MKSILIVGSGAREHALAWKLRQSPDVGALYVAPGNAGTTLLAKNVAIAATDLPAIIRFVEERDVALTVVGPEAPLALGLADGLRLRGRRVVGPGAAAARIESSKSFAKQLMLQAGVPTAPYAVFDRPENALRYIARAHFPLVVKADGLAAGKGVSICRDEHEARETITSVMVDGVHGSAGRRVVVEEALSGPEISLLALVDGERVVTLPVAQDHKRLGDGDTGPNTGGMGAYAPVPFLDADEQASLSKTVLEPVIAALAELGTPYQGVLFAGLMLTDSGPKVLEYNCRSGDPETQVILPLLADDLLPWLEAVAVGAGGHGGLQGTHKGMPLQGPVPVCDRSAVGVVLAAPGYPERPEVGTEIKGLEDVEENVLVFHAGTEQDAHGHVVTAGGRVLTVVGTGTSIEAAARRAYAAPVWFEGMQRRGDIAWQGILHPPPPSPSRGEGESFAGDESRKDADPQFPSPHRGRGVRGEGARIAVLASGEGSNLQALLDACRRGDVDAEIAVVVSNRAEARALERARRAGVPDIALPLRDREPDPHEGGKPDSHEGGKPHTRRLYEEQLLEVLRPFELDLIVLAGWMLILSAHFLDQCPCPLINVHPALLKPGTPPRAWVTPSQAWVTPGVPHPEGHPSGLRPRGTRPAWVTPFPVLRGAHAVRDALALGLPYTGVSIHYVTPEVDAGPVILSEPVPIELGDDEDSLYRRIKAVEHRLLPRAVQTVLREGRESMLVAKSPHPPTSEPATEGPAYRGRREGEKQCRHTSKSPLSQGGRGAGGEGISAARMIRREYP